MAKLTNNTKGLRGIRKTDGELVWLEPGASVDIPENEIAQPLPDLGQEGSLPALDASNDEAIERVREQVAQAAQQHIERIQADHGHAIGELLERAETAESDLSDTKTANAELQEKLDVATARVTELEAQKTDPAPWMIAAAVNQLDGENDEHWTADGQPKVDAVAELLGAHLMRADITAAAPDAKRPAK